ncbi:MAG: DUF5659 domain-containing protein [Candidatus Kapabacteria bacterium]|nr:DUF5659 domain-containing protein [Candidatus Kapabacteria bacterium]
MIAIKKEPEYLPFSEQFLTFDIGLATSLVSLGFELWNLDKSEIKKVQFVFKRNDGIDLVIRDYWQDNLPINARTLIDNQKMLKNRIYSSE